MDSRRNSEDSVEIILTNSHTNQAASSISTPSIQPQRYKYLLIIDFEASLDPSTGTHEMIEFPLLLLSTTTSSLTTISEFHTFIRPQRHTNGNIKNRNAIPQPILASSPTFPEAWKSMLEFLEMHGVTEENALAATCGDWDYRSMLPIELSYHKIEGLGLFEKWCNIKQAFKLFTGKKAHSMIRMLNVIGEKLVGTHHSGIDDARNIAGIARWMFQRGYVFKVTSEGVVDEEDLLRQERLRREKEDVKKEVERTRIERLKEGKVDPREMFRDEEVYLRWDEDGIPLFWRDGRPLSKSAVNKRRKMWLAQKALHERYLAWRQLEP